MRSPSADAGRLMASLLLVAAALPAVILGADLTFYLPTKPSPFTLPPSTHATLSALGQRHAAPLTVANTFVFRNVTPGSYLADVHCSTDAFQPLRVDVTKAAAEEGGKVQVQAWETFRGNDWDNKGEAVPVREGSAGRGVELRAVAAKNYFMERPKFSILTILKNPMILMGLVTMGLFFGMPYLMDNMDPELRAEFEARQKESPMNAVMGGGASAENPLGNFDMAAYLAGSGKKDSGSSKK